MRLADRLRYGWIAVVAWWIGAAVLIARLVSPEPPSDGVGFGFAPARPAADVTVASQRPDDAR